MAFVIRVNLGEAGPICVGRGLIRFRLLEPTVESGFEEFTGLSIGDSTSTISAWFLEGGLGLDVVVEPSMSITKLPVGRVSSLVGTN